MANAIFIAEAEARPFEEAGKFDVTIRYQKDTTGAILYSYTFNSLASADFNTALAAWLATNSFSLSTTPYGVIY